MTAIKLTKPIQHDGKTYYSIAIRAPSLASVAAYVAAAQQGDLPAAIALLAVNAEMPEEALRKVPFSVFAEAMQAMTPFFSTIMGARPLGTLARTRSRRSAHVARLARRPARYAVGRSVEVARERGPIRQGARPACHGPERRG